MIQWSPKHRTRELLFLTELAVAAGLGVACGPPGADSGSSADDVAACGTSADTYQAGMEATCDTDACRVVLLQADPAPPDVGDNVWTVQGTDADGTTLDDLVGVRFEPVMPEHGHGTSPPSFDATTDDGQTWTSPPMDWFMSGLWETSVVLVDADAAEHIATFTFCAEG